MGWNTSSMAWPREVTDPEKGGSVLEADGARWRLPRGGASGDKAEVRNRADLRIGALGAMVRIMWAFSGFCRDSRRSTWALAAKIAEAAVITPSTTISGGTRTLPIRSLCMGGLWPRLVQARRVMRMADAELIPYNFANTADTVATYVDEVKKLLKTNRWDLPRRTRRSTKGCSRRRAIRRTRWPFQKRNCSAV